MSRNDTVASLLEEFADLLDAKGVEYKPRAYRRAAENIRDHPGDIEGLAAEGAGAVGKIEGVGDAISAKVVEYFETGGIGELDELRAELPVDMAALTAIEGVGPKTVGSLYEQLGITTLDELEAAAEAGEIQEIKGFGAKTEQNILDNIEFARQASAVRWAGLFGGGDPPSATWTCWSGVRIARPSSKRSPTGRKSRGSSRPAKQRPQFGPAAFGSTSE